MNPPSSPSPSTPTYSTHTPPKHDDKLAQHVFNVAMKTPGFLSLQEGLALRLYSRNAPPQPAVEIGSYCGRSTLFLAQGRKEANSFLLSVDHHRGSQEHQPGQEWHNPSLFNPDHNLMDTLPVVRKTLLDAHMSDYVVLAVAASPLVAKIAHDAFSLVFIDGAHDLQSALNDWRSWGDKIVKNGFLAIHDVFPNPKDGGQAPHTIYKCALDSSLFQEVAAVDSLRILIRQ